MINMRLATAFEWNIHIIKLYFGTKKFVSSTKIYVKFKDGIFGRTENNIKPWRWNITSRIESRMHSQRRRQNAYKERNKSHFSIIQTPIKSKLECNVLEGWRHPNQWNDNNFSAISHSNISYRCRYIEEIFEFLSYIRIDVFFFLNKKRQ